MKRLILITFVGLFVNQIAFADNSERIKELTTEYQQMADKRQNLINETQKCEVRMIEIQGIVKELSPKPEEKKK